MFAVRAGRLPISVVEYDPSATGKLASAVPRAAAASAALRAGDGGTRVPLGGEAQQQRAADDTGIAPLLDRDQAVAPCALGREDIDKMLDVRALFDQRAGTDMIVQPPAEAGVAQQRMAEGIEEDAAHVALVDRTDRAVARIEHRQQTEAGYVLEQIDCLPKRLAQANRRPVQCGRGRGRRV